jgi:hydroxyacylglutathione hydrolase
MPAKELEIAVIPLLKDNYGYLVHDAATGKTAAVDPSVAPPMLAAATERGWRISHILNTHNHGDHVGGNKAIQEATGCRIVGFGPDAERIPGITQRVGDGERVRLGEAEAEVLFVPGHTRGHIAYWFAADRALFCGDTLFALGCGRLFEGTPQQMWPSLSRLRALPDDTRVYCAHEYTASNLRFALTVESDNAALLERGRQVTALRAQQRPTVPSLLGEEKATNPFLRADRPSVAAAVGLPHGDPIAVFAEVRRRKDVFR